MHGTVHQRASTRRGVPAALALFFIIALTGCTSGPKPHTGLPPVAPEDTLKQPSIYPALQGTVKSFATLASDIPVMVKGYGLVVNLPKTGSGEMPSPVRSMLIKQLEQEGFGYRSSGLHKLNPEELLRSRQVAAVYVQGIIPALAPRGTTFDLQVAALPDTQTTNLTNGLLWTTPLRVHVQPGNATKPIAAGRGPLFCNPFVKRGKAAGNHALVRSGRVLAGGITTRTLPAVLELYTPSYRIAGLIQRVINERFGDNPRYANAQTDNLITLRVPPRFDHRPKAFVNLCMHLYLQQDIPGFAESQSIRLLKALHDPAAPHKEISRCLVALGRPIIPVLRKHYASANAAVGFYSARAGAMLHDSEATVALQQFARLNGNKYQMAAIHAISHDRDTMQGTVLLSHLLGNKSLAVRVAAYHALLRSHSIAVDSRAVGEKFLVDLVHTRGPQLVYVTQVGLPRIALIGRHFDLAPGTLYISPHDTITVNYPPPSPHDPPAGKKAKFPVKLYYRSRVGNQAVKLRCTPHIAGLLVELGSAPDPRSPTFDPYQPYIGASYQRIVQMLHYMCNEGMINAHFVLQRPPAMANALVNMADKQRPQGGRLRPHKLRPANPYNTALPGEKR